MKTIYKKLLFLMVLLPFSMLAQNTLNGVIVDAKTNDPVPGANVIVKGTQNSASSDFDGKFRLDKLKNGDKISISFLGYADQEISFNGQKSITVKLQEEANLLQEVVVQIGYGTVKKKDATGAVATLGSDDFNKGAVVTAENALNGKIAGVSINTSGAPGSGSEIRIRGGSSLSANNDPLIVVDGLPLSPIGVNGATSNLASINPNDIASFTILKDASATAIYGSRASNGVIIITTKRGSKKLAVDYNFQYGSGKVFNKIDVFSAQAYRDLITTRGNTGQISKLGNASTDWQDEIYRRTDYVDNNISIRGSAFGVLPARLSFGNTYQEGLRLTNSLTRNTFSINLTPSLLNDHLKLSLAANYSNQKNRFADGVEGAAIRFDPTQPVYDANSPYNGFFEYYSTNEYGQNQFANPSIANPVAQLLQTIDKGKADRIFGNFEVDYKFHFLPELRAVVNLGYDRNSGSRRIFRPTTARSSGSNNNINLGTRFGAENVATNKLLDAYFVYKKKFGKVDFDATAGYSYQRFENRGAEGYDSNSITNIVGNIFQRPFIADDIVLLGYFARANFNVNDKYLLTLSYRRDGTSRFSSENRFGNFPAAAFAWKIREDFFKESTVISDLKLRLGYGITGQQEIGASLFYLPLYNIGNPNSQYTLGNTSFPVGQPAAYNPNLKWEETTTYNAGLDFGIVSNKVTGTLDVYYKKSTDLFQGSAPFADGSNFSNEGPQNVGSMSIKGIELGIDFALFKSDKFQWDINVNASKYERRIDKIAAGLPIFVGGSGAGTGGTSQILAEGYTPNSFYVYKQLFNAANQPIEGAYADLNGDGIINGSDRYIHYNGDPDLQLGFTSNIRYNNLDLSFNLRANIGNRVLNTFRSTGSYYSQLENGQLQNTTTNLLNTNFETQTGETVISDIFVENASFLRMDYATLGYTFKNWLEAKSTLRLFGGVQNPFIITKYSGLDPELTGGIDQTIYPRQRQILFGANVKF
jgi:TonB-linked SusC/RagA family outer membrane protein